MVSGLSFERRIIELESKIEELKHLAATEKVDLSAEIKQLNSRLEKVKHEIFDNLTPWQRVQIARHPQRPYTLDYINLMLNDFIELHGDRCFGDDKALVGGLAKLDDLNIMVLGHQKGRDTKENLLRNFGSAHPEGYRKALRLMKLAERFTLPILILVDTPGAYPGVGAEERGQAQAIAVNLEEMAALKVPIVIFVIGEGGSGGALGVGVGDKVCVLENAYYSVISPEGCAAILWKDRARAEDACIALKLTAKDLLDLGVIDEILEEPLGGAHRNHEEMAKRIKEKAKAHFKELKALPPEELLEKRYQKFRKMGAFSEPENKD
jgi:acetyl-CoA carboxylase carboxyl transferase subunit alpha